MTYQVSTNSIAQPVVIVDSAGAQQSAGNVNDPMFTRTVGSPTLAHNQVADSISPAAATLIVAARAGRHSVTLVNITGTQPVFFGNVGVTVANGQYLGAVAGASVSLLTSAAIYATSPTAAQTIGFIELY